MDDGPTTHEVLMQCRGLRRIYDRRHSHGGDASPLIVLDGLDMEIRRGEMISIVGQSGVGKSTLLHILGTLDRPTSGEVFYHGEDVFSRPEPALAAFRNRTIGFVFQFHHLLAEFSALENVMLPVLVSGVNRREAAGRAAPLLEEVGLADRMEHKPGELSGGEQQRVAIARALVMNPEVVFADEPTGNLDSRTSEEIHHLLVRLNERMKTAFVVVTHNVKLAWLLERHLLLQHGRVRELNEDEAPEAFLPKSKEPAP